MLSEMPLTWHRQAREWRKLNSAKKQQVGGAEAPSANDEYHLYQTLIGAWPLDLRNGDDEAFIMRMCDYMQKAVREGKMHSTWANPNQTYESALRNFVREVIASKQFRDSFLPFHRRIAYVGMLNSLSQALIKLTAPGVPDMYQGTELWDFSLVDPDNRRAVDYATRSNFLDQLRTIEDARTPRGSTNLRSLIRSTTRKMEDGRIKLFTISRTLALRKRWPELFSGGAYIPLTVTGARAKHLLAFARKLEDKLLIVAVPRLCAELLGRRRELPCGPRIWNGTTVELPVNPPARLRNVLTDELTEVGSQPNVHASTLLAQFPVALLISEPE